MENDLYQNPESHEVAEGQTPVEVEVETVPTPSQEAETKKLPLIETRFAEVNVTHDERTMAALAHFSIILTLLTGGFAGWLVAFVIWAAYRNRSRWVANQAFQSLVFQIAATLAAYALGLLAAGAIAVSSILMTILIGFCMLPFALVFGLVAFVFPFVATAYGLWGALETYNGRDFQYGLVGDLVREKATT